MVSVQYNIIMYSVLVTVVLLTGSVLTARNFPPEFKFGVATASYQIEGGWDADGKGENIWDHICHTNPDFIYDQDNGDIACDSYNKWEQDIANIKALGVDFYRLSLSWSRILSNGRTDSINQNGIDYYRRVLEGLVNAGIEPLVTLFHWDTPQALQETGGFTDPEIVTLFEDYARLAFERYGDIVKNWLTFNEPKQTCHEGYGDGTKAPGIKSSGLDEYICTHNLIKAHARAWHLYNDEFKPTQQGRVSITIDQTWFEPANSTEPLDEVAAERSRQFIFGWYANPIYNRNYPQVMIDRIEQRSLAEGYEQSRLPQFTEEELDYISGTHDFMGVNFYSANLAQFQEDAPIGEVSFANDMGVRQFQDPNWGSSASDWLKVTPWAFRKFMNWLKVTYDNPEIIITENGFSDNSGTLDDQERIAYYEAYLSNLLDAILVDGVNVTGYTAWSLMDNFEWTRGYSEHFGLYQVNFTDPERARAPKESAIWYKQLTSTHCLEDCE